MNQVITRAMYGIALGFFMLVGAQVSAAVVTVTDFSDSTPGLFGTASPDPTDGNRWIIGLDEFMVDGSSPDSATAFDTLAFTVTAPEGHKITRISYTESGTVNPNGGTVVVNGSLVVNGETQGFSEVRTGDDSGNWSLDSSLSGELDSAIVSITNALFAFGNGAVLAKDTAVISFEVSEVPVPASVLFMASALAGMTLVRRRSERSLAV